MGLAFPQQEAGGPRLWELLPCPAVLPFGSSQHLEPRKGDRLPPDACHGTSRGGAGRGRGPRTGRPPVSRLCRQSAELWGREQAPVRGGGRELVGGTLPSGDSVDGAPLGSSMAVFRNVRPDLLSKESPA